MNRTVPARAARLAVVATAAAGALGWVRHLIEGRTIRRGTRPRTLAATRTLPPKREDPLSRHLAHWLPGILRHPAARFTAAAWCAPVTLVGMLVGATSGGRWSRSAEHDCWVVVDGRRGFGWVQRLGGITATTFGRVVVCRTRNPSPVLLAHEAVHVRQAERLGPVTVVAYAWLAARWGYRNHPMERAARRGAERWAATLRR